MASLVSDQFINDLVEKDIFELMGADDASQEEKEEMYVKMVQTIQMNAGVRIYQELSETDRDELDKIIGQGDDQKVIDYLHSKNLDLIGILTEETMGYKAQLASLFHKDKE